MFKTELCLKSFPLFTKFRLETIQSLNSVRQPNEIFWVIYPVRKVLIWFSWCKKTSSKTKLNSSQSRLRWLSHNHSWRYLQLDYPCKEILSSTSPFKTRPTLKLASTIDFVLYFQLDGILYNICKVYFGKTNIQTIINPKYKECQYI